MFGQDDKSSTSAQPMSTKPVNNGLLGIDDDGDDSVPPVTPAASQAPSDPPPIPDTPTLGSIDEPKDVSSDSSKVPSDPVTFTPDPYATPPAYAQQTTTTTPTTTDDLVNIKRQALQDLSPLINHLDQTPDEKFKTTMMMIQASDDKDLIPQAYQVAKDIPDEKKRAQALLDIVNEINYFTHKTED